MKDYEEMQMMNVERKRMINIHLEAIKYHQDQINDINSTTIEQEFYLGNINFLDYPGNEWMRDLTRTYTCYHCDNPMLTTYPTDPRPSDNELVKLVCSECKDKMWSP